MPLSRTRDAPVFLSKEQHTELQRFIREQPSARPQVFLPVGTRKSGKSTVLNELLPGMLAAAYQNGWPSTRPRPVIFSHALMPIPGTEVWVMDLHHNLESFGRFEINVPFDKATTPDAALNNLPRNLEKFAERIKAGGGELWLVLDELQGPLLGATQAEAELFTDTIKQVSLRYVPPRMRPLAVYKRATAQHHSRPSLAAPYTALTALYVAYAFRRLMCRSWQGEPTRAHCRDQHRPIHALQLLSHRSCRRLQVVGCCVVPDLGPRAIGNGGTAHG